MVGSDSMVGTMGELVVGDTFILLLIDHLIMINLIKKKVATASRNPLERISGSYIYLKLKINFFIFSKVSFSILTEMVFFSNVFVFFKSKTMID